MKTTIAILICVITLSACSKHRVPELLKITPIPDHNFVELSEPGHYYFQNFKIIPQSDNQLLVCTSVQVKDSTLVDPCLELIKLDDRLKMYNHLKTNQPYSVLALSNNKKFLNLAVENYETHQPAILHVSQTAKVGMRFTLPINISSKCVTELDKDEFTFFDRITDEQAIERYAMNSYNLDGKLKQDIAISDEIQRDVLSQQWFAPVGSFINKKTGVTFASVDTLTGKQYMRRISFDGKVAFSSAALDFPISAITPSLDSTYVCGILPGTNQLQIICLNGSLLEFKRFTYEYLKPSSWIKGLILLPNGFAVLNNYFLTNDLESTTDIQVIFFDLKGKFISSEEIGLFSNYLGWTFELVSQDKVGVFGWSKQDMQTKSNRMIYGNVEVPESIR